MPKRYQTLRTIEYSFAASIIASFSVVGLAGFLFGFQLSQWAEWEGILVGLTAVIAGVFGAVFGLRMSLNQNL
jgi:hypothetical protein